MLSRTLPTVALLSFGLAAPAAEAGRGDVYAVVELAFRGPPQTAKDAPARDLELKATFRHESGAEHTVYGFHDGGVDWKVRFCPTKPGRWDIAAVKSNAKELDGQHKGDHVTAVASKRHGFWEADDDSPGRRWYRRSDGSHQYVVGNTQYSFLSGMKVGGPSGVDVAADMAANARYFKKLRFSFTGDRYPHPVEKPFLDDAGRPTDNGDHSHRPNPKWFRERVDVAVRAAFAHDVVADLILAGPDTDDARATLRAAANGGDATPYLRYVAARYGSYPNVWLCLCNEYDIRTITWQPADVAKFGAAVKRYLPYPTPLSVHPWPHPDKGPRKAEEPAWSMAFDKLPPWNDHQIIQRKLKTIAASADVIGRTWQPPGHPPRNKPTVNDELSYQGEGDKHTEGDTLEAHLGAFLGGGYGSTGEKRGNKLGHYFWGGFDPKEHTAAEGLKFLREAIDRHVTFWKMAPDAATFPNLDPAFRALAWPGREYALGTDKAAKVVAELPAGTWTVRRFDVVARTEATLTTTAAGRYEFDAPASRAVLFHLKKNEAAAGNWPGFRGPTGQGHAADGDLPLTWDATTNVAWSAAVPGEGWSSPVVWGDAVFVTSATDAGRSCRVLSFDRRTGAPRFDVEVFRQAPSRKEGRNSYATPTPVTDGQRVYAVFGAGGVAAVDFGGNVVWTNREVEHYSRHGLGASPVLAGGLLVMPYDGSQRVEPSTDPKAPISEAEKVGWKTPWEEAVVVALDPATGRRVWTGRRGPSRVAHVTPLAVAVAGKVQLVSPAGDCIQAFDPADGRRLWSLPAQGEGVVPSPAAGDGLLFTCSGFEATALRAVRLGAVPAVAWEERKGVPTRPSPVYVAPYLYAVTEAGIASCWEGATGKLVWRERLPGEYSSSPVYAAGRLYCLNEAGVTTVLAAGPEFRVLARNPLGARCCASMAVAGGQLFVRTDRQIVAVGRSRAADGGGR